jgi:hypothetical protein
MTESKSNKQQIITLLKKVALGAKVGEICRECGVSEVSNYKWKSADAGKRYHRLRTVRRPP